MDKLDLILQKLESLDELKQIVTRNTALLNQQGDMLTQLISIVGATNQKVSDMQSDIAIIKDGQDRQDKILESLAIRQLEQESDLRHIQRAK